MTNQLQMPNFKDIFIKRLYPLIGVDYPGKSIFDSKEFYSQSQSEVEKLAEMVKVRDGFKKIRDHQSKNIGYIKNFRYHICETIYHTGAVVSGSFILDCLYDTNYHGDIDIYDLIMTSDECENILAHDDDHRPKGRVLKHLKSRLAGADVLRYYYEFGLQTLTFTQFLQVSGFLCVKSEKDKEILPAKNLIRNYVPIEISVDNFDSSIKSPIQVIPVEMTQRSNVRSPINKLINASYDLDICKNIFNGRELMVRSWTKLMARYDYIKPKIKRFMTYYENSHCDVDTNDDDSGTRDRMEKYKSRGFNIQSHPQTEDIKRKVFDAMMKPPKVDTKFFRRDVIRMIEDGKINLDDFYLENIQDKL